MIRELCRRARSGAFVGVKPHSTRGRPGALMWPAFALLALAPLSAGAQGATATVNGTASYGPMPQDGVAAKDELVDSKVDVVDMNGAKVVRHVLLGDDPCYEQKDQVRSARDGLASFHGQNDQQARSYLARVEQAARDCIASPPGPPPPSAQDVNALLSRAHQHLWQEANAPMKTKPGTKQREFEESQRAELKAECDGIRAAQKMVLDR